MKIKLLSLSLGVILLAGCSKFEKRPLSAIQIDQDALPNHATIKVVHFSGGPDANENQEYYYQYTVVEQESLDTFRVLCAHAIILDSMPKRYVAANSGNKEDMLMMLTLTPNANNEIPQNIDNMKAAPEAKTEKVIFNSDYADIEQRPYPYVMGYIVTVLNNKK